MGNVKKEAVVRSSGRRRAMSVRKSRFISKILAGVVTTIVAPVLANVVGQQVDDWQHTLKILVENEPPAAKANWNLPTAERDARYPQAGDCGRPSAVPPAYTSPVGKAGDWRSTASYSREESGAGQSRNR
jgi:hypothetical protein